MRELDLVHGPIQGTFLGIVLFALACAITIGSLADVHVPLRGEHYRTPKRFYQAQQAHVILADPNSDCRVYDCEVSRDSVLRVCIGDLEGATVYAMQWLIVSGEEVLEGTSFVQRDAGKAERYIRNNGCGEVE